MDGGPIEHVRSLWYLGRVLSEDDDKTPCVEAQLKKTRQRWARLAKVLKREEANARAVAIFYTTISQSVLLYGAELWTPLQRQIHVLERFHKRTMRHITGCHIQQDAAGNWS